MLRHFLTVVAGLSLLTGCAGHSVTSSPAPPAATLAPVPTGAILLAQENDPTRHDPRNITVCQEYLEHVAKERQVDAAQSRAIDIRTFWLDKRPTPSASANCQEALDNYDFERAAGEIKKIRPAATGNGPFLVAYIRGNAAPRLIIDGSAADTDEKLRAAVADYLAVAGDPATYRAASAGVRAAPPRQRRSVCERLASANPFSGGTGSNVSVGAYFAVLAAILVAEVAICAIGA
jgi:hypothetical protein